MYTVKLYNNTGFNPENIPDRAALLGTAFVEKQAVDTVQNYVISEVRLSAVFNDVKNVDYCQIGDFYYFVSGVTMTSRDVCILSLIPDYITSFGLSNIEFLDGITVRHHVDDDTFGAYPEEDPLLFCDQPLVLDVGTPQFDEGTDDYEGDYTIVTSTASLSEMGGGSSFNSVTYTDPSGNEVTVPHLKPAAWGTGFKSGAANKEYYIPGQAAFLITDDANGQVVIDGIQYCRDIAAETAITGQYRIPKLYVTINNTVTPSWWPSTWPALPQNCILELTGRELNAATGLAYEFNANVKNKRVLYGEFCKYGFITRSGNKMEAKPEEIIESGATSPTVIMTADPRPDGRPYFRFKTINGQTPVTGNGFDTSFWRNAVPGEQWAQIPLVFTTPSGIVQQQKYYDTSFEVLEKTRDNSMMARNAAAFARTGNAMINIASAGMARGTSLPMNQNNTSLNLNKPFSGDINMTRVGGALNSFSNWVGGKAQRNIEDLNYYNERGSMDYQMGMLKNLVIPDVMFPYTSGSIRDFVGNGVLPYRYKPSAMDIAIQDKLLTMYGYRDSEVLEQSHFFNRQYFNYVQANNISIGNNLPQWWKAGIVAQLAAGVRVWHVTPNESYYTSGNPIAQ